jgi:hypothetical protein
MDTLTGGLGTDWFFAKLTGGNKDKVVGQVNGEIITTP